MRKTFFCIALLLAAHRVAAAPANYAGTWVLDKASSKDLPPFYDSVKTHHLKITQNEKELSIAVEITSDAHDPDHFDFTYRLDGTPVATETQVRTPNGPMSVPTTLTARPAENGGLAITIERELPSRGGGEPMKGTTVETWRLDQDGKTLTIDRVDEMPRGRFASTLVFQRS